MTSLHSAVDTPRALSRLRRLWHTEAARRFASNRSAVVGALMLLSMALLVSVGPMFLADPTAVDPASRLAAPSISHPLGTDQLGRDLLARSLTGGRISFTVAIASSLLLFVPSAILGMIAGYVGGVVDEIISRILDVLMTFPSLLLALIVVAALGPDLSSVIVAIAISNIARYGRLFRALTLEARDLEYVQSARSLGYSPIRILIRHILPNIIVPVLVVVAGNMGRVAQSEAALSFLGAGVQPPTPSWGNMMGDAQQYLQVYPLYALVPGIMLTIVTVSFSFVGDGLQDALDIRIATE